jgi:cyclophilin family peptidyl-prolyl cis-trans isomerase
MLVASDTIATRGTSFCIAERAAESAPAAQSNRIHHRPFAHHGVAIPDGARLMRTKITHLRPRVVQSAFLAASVVLGSLVATGCATDEQPADASGSSSTSNAASSPPSGTASTPSIESDTENASMSHYRMTTSMGEIIIELDPEKAPISAANFAAYANADRYDGTIFHRVIEGFMIQGGGFNPDMTKRPTDAPISNEWQNGLANNRGTLAMARLGGDADSATNQFFINHADNAFLDAPQPDGAAYAVFGRVIAGMSTVDAIAAVRTTNVGGYGDVPAEPIMIEKIDAITADQASELAGSMGG